MSTSYYAVFHFIVQAGAERFIGSAARGSAAYGLLYRSFNHGRMRAVCAAVNVARLSPTYQQQLGRASVSADMRAFAAVFPILQDARHLADYDPAVAFTPADASDRANEAASAMATFGRVLPEEQADVLALMLANPRA